jgi:hypothetical protein
MLPGTFQIPKTIARVTAMTALALAMASVSHATPQESDASGDAVVEIAAETGETVYHSWHVDHPVTMGVVSALTLALFPARFGDDVEERIGGMTMNYGYGPDAYEYVHAASLRIFNGTRHLVLMIMGFLTTLLLLRSRAQIGALAMRIKARAVKR